jgi:type IV pilus assembly protein PilM
MDIKPLLLARVVREATAVIVDVQTTEFDIVIMTDGVSQPIRTIPFASEALSSEEKLTIIKNELDRTITFYNSNNPENALTSSVPIFVSGELADEPELCQTLSDQIGNTVLPLSSPLECPEGFSPSRYMANIGLVLQKLVSGKAAGPAVVNLNALPAAYQPKPISLTNVLGLPGGVVAIGLLVFLAMLVQGTSANMASISDQLNTTNQLLQQKLSQRQELTGQIAELENKITEVESASGNFTAALGSLETQSTGINRHLKITLESLPNTITLSSISYANNILTISGWAPSEREVSSYISNLGTGGRFGEITVANMSRIEGEGEGEGEGMDFTLLSSLQTEGDGTSSIEIALNNLPATISLTSVSSTDGTLTINGSSPDEYGILSYAQSLEASGEFSEITISRMTRIEDEGMDFSLVLKTGE